MGYVKSSVTAYSVKGALFQVLPISIDKTNEITGTAPTEVYKNTLDWSDIDYIYFSLDLEATGWLSDLYIKFDGVAKVTDLGNAPGMAIQGEIDLTAVSGVSPITIVINNSNVAGVTHIENLKMWCREA